MKTTTVLLTGLFLAQVAAAGVLYFNKVSQRSVRPEGTLLTLDQADPDFISIEGDESTINLQRQDATWTVASNGLPVDVEKLDSVLDALKALQLGWAVATTDASHTQLEVADDNFQRRVSIKQGDEMIGELYLGTSPGFRRTHARRAGQSDVYSVAVNTYDLPDSTEGWLDKSLLQVTEVAAVQIDGKPLSKDGDNWVFDGSDQTDQEQASELVRSFETLRVLDVVEEVEESVEFSTVSVNSDNDGYEYRFGETDGSYLVARSDVDATFSISQATYDKIINAELLPLESAEMENNSGDHGEDEQAGANLTTDTSTE